MKLERACRLNVVTILMIIWQWKRGDQIQNEKSLIRKANQSQFKYKVAKLPPKDSYDP